MYCLSKKVHVYLRNASEIDVTKKEAGKTRFRTTLPPSFEVGKRRPFVTRDKKKRVILVKRERQTKVHKAKHTEHKSTQPSTSCNRRLKAHRFDNFCYSIGHRTNSKKQDEPLHPPKLPKRDAKVTAPNTR